MLFVLKICLSAVILYHLFSIALLLYPVYARHALFIWQ